MNNPNTINCWSSSYGLGGGFQADFFIAAPTPVGLGLGSGLKWQLPRPSGELFAVAIATRGVVSVAGNFSAGSGASFLLASAEIGPIISVHPLEAHALYFSPWNGFSRSILVIDGWPVTLSVVLVPNESAYATWLEFMVFEFMDYKLKIVRFSLVAYCQDRDMVSIFDLEEGYITRDSKRDEKLA